MQDSGMLTLTQVKTLLRTSESSARRLLDKLAERGGYQVERLTDVSPRRISRAGLQKYAEEQRLRVDWSLLE